MNSKKSGRLFGIENVAESREEKKKIMEDAALRQYSMELLKSQAANLAMTLLVAIISGQWLEVLVFEIAFMTLRRYAGGYHSSNSSHCFFLSSAVLVSVIFGNAWLAHWFTTGARASWPLLLWGLAAGVFIFLSAPVEAVKKPLDSLEREVYGKRARITTVIQMTVEYVLLFLEMDLGRLLMLTHTAVALSMLAGMLLQHTKGAEEKNPQSEGNGR